MTKQFTIILSQGSKIRDEKTGTFEELLNHYMSVLELGKRYENEPGAKKINLTPKTATSLVAQLNNATNNQSPTNRSLFRYLLV